MIDISWVQNYTFQTKLPNLLGFFLLFDRENPFDFTSKGINFAAEIKKQYVEQLKKYTIMKKILTALVALMTLSVSANAMSYEQARREALFLTDKMAYELNLSDAQYDAAYEINLDYLMGVTSVDDVYGTYWTRRNLDISYILLDWQWNAFCAASYFYRPLYWSAGCWHFGIYARYPHRSYYYFHRPTVYV